MSGKDYLLMEILGLPPKALSIKDKEALEYMRYYLGDYLRDEARSVLDYWEAVHVLRECRGTTRLRLSRLGKKRKIHRRKFLNDY